jgi:hypothetical protein
MASRIWPERLQDEFGLGNKVWVGAVGVPTGSGSLLNLTVPHTTKIFAIVAAGKPNSVTTDIRVLNLVARLLEMPMYRLCNTFWQLMMI